MNEVSPGAPTRRHLLAAFAAAMIGTAAGATGRMGKTLPGSTPRLPGTTAGAELEEWRSAVGRSFRVSGGGRVRLVAVEALPSSGPRPPEIRAQAFAAVFETAAGTVEDDRTYRLWSLSSPSLEVHFGPKIPAGARARHIAVFN